MPGALFEEMIPVLTTVSVPVTGLLPMPGRALPAVPVWVIVPSFSMVTPPPVALAFQRRSGLAVLTEMVPPAATVTSSVPLIEVLVVMVWPDVTDKLDIGALPRLGFPAPARAAGETLSLVW
jgi:hypothetical protein